jgi:hypothetical protein
MQMLYLISTKMMDTVQDLQHQLVQNDLKFTVELQKILQENETFRQNIIADVQRSSLMMNPASVVPWTSATFLGSSPSVLPSNTSSSGVSAVSTTVLPVSPPQDFQQQMLSMLNDTFSKLITVMTKSKATDSKSDWPKFSGDTKKFKHWYLAIVAQLSLAPWKEFYNSTSNTLVKTTGNISLNEKLYAKLLLCLEGQLFKIWSQGSILEAMVFYF